ncbi:MAG: HIT family protein [Candidatus Micrarchaeota archaeon]
MDCIFCKIVSKEIPSSVVYEDETALAFLDINPLSKGHTLVIPKKHYGSIHEASEEDMAELAKAVKKVAGAIKKTTGSDGINIIQNNGKAAEQLVPHMHFHIIPRFKDDGLVSKWPTKKYGEGEMENLRKRMAESL